MRPIPILPLCLLLLLLPHFSWGTISSGSTSISCVYSTSTKNYTQNKTGNLFSERYPWVGSVSSPQQVYLCVSKGTSDGTSEWVPLTCNYESYGFGGENHCLVHTTGAMSYVQEGTCCESKDANGTCIYTRRLTTTTKTAGGFTFEYRIGYTCDSDSIYSSSSSSTPSPSSSSSSTPSPSSSSSSGYDCDKFGFTCVQEYTASGGIVAHVTINNNETGESATRSYLGRSCDLAQQAFLSGCGESGGGGGNSSSSSDEQFQCKGTVGYGDSYRCIMQRGDESFLCPCDGCADAMRPGSQCQDMINDYFKPESSGSGGGSSSGSGGGSGEGSSGSGGGEEGDFEYDYRDSLRNIHNAVNNLNQTAGAGVGALNDIRDGVNNINSNMVAQNSSINSNITNQGLNIRNELSSGFSDVETALGKVGDSISKERQEVNEAFERYMSWMKSDVIPIVQGGNEDLEDIKVAVTNDSVPEIRDEWKEEKFEIGLDTNVDLSEYEIDLDTNLNIDSLPDSLMNMEQLPDSSTEYISNALGDFLRTYEKALDDSLISGGELLSKFNDSLAATQDSMFRWAFTSMDSVKWSPWDSIMNVVLPPNNDACPEECFNFELELPIAGFKDQKYTASADFAEWLCQNSALTAVLGKSVGVLYILRMLLRFMAAVTSIYIIMLFWGKK